MQVFSWLSAVDDLHHDFCLCHSKHVLQVLWMNTTLRTMWPYYNHAVGQQVLEQVNPIIAEQLKPVRPS